jgi:hypothetical protein
MLSQTNYTVNTDLFQEACQTSPEIWQGKTVVNQPTGNFFYDSWELKDQYRNTVWHKIYDSLPVSNKGEARIIVLDPGQAYQSHADIDDRYHLNVQGSECFLIDLDKQNMHKLEQDGIWYDMDASMHHTAANFGRIHRVQLVIRKLLDKHALIDPSEITITTKMDNLDHTRYIFDNSISPWLNTANKAGNITDFEYAPSYVKFKIERACIQQLKNNLPKEFELNEPRNFL